jgi:hypothetical protein
MIMILVSLNVFFVANQEFVEDVSAFVSDY